MGPAMSTFEEREQSFEAMFKHDQELRFKVHSRANKLLGLWAAAKLGLTGEAAEAYAREVVSAEFDGPNDREVVNKVTTDLAGCAGIDRDIVRHELDRFLSVAKEQIWNEPEQAKE